MAIPLIGGAGIPLSVSAGIGPAPSGVRTGITNAMTLLAAKTYTPPAGTYILALGLYTVLQWVDPVTNIARTIAGYADGPIFFQTPGANFRIANLTGTPIGALITTAGSGYTNGIGTMATGLTVTASAGASTWSPIVGGANNTITVTTAGTGYLYAPNLIVDAPPAGGMQATATCTISGGAVNAATFTNVGAGYVTVPNITVVNDPRDTAGSGCVLTASALTGSGTLTGLFPSNHGTVLTAVPTFTFSPASTTAATAIMNFTVTGFTATAGGAAYGNAQPFMLLSSGGLVAGTSVLTNPLHTTGLTHIRQARLDGVSTSGGAITATGIVVTDGGNGFQAVPNLGVIPAGNSLPTTIAQATATVGGVSDTFWLQPV